MNFFRLLCLSSKLIICRKMLEKEEVDDNDETGIDAATYKAREWDDFKDTNPRGWGKISYTFALKNITFCSKFKSSFYNAPGNRVGKG